MVNGLLLIYLFLFVISSILVFVDIIFMNLYLSIDYNFFEWRVKIKFIRNI